jgi:CRISPR/Cas system-associated exonuclease Cas4 (RecB family)
MHPPIENLKSKIVNQFAFSQSSLQDYTDCPRRFQLRYIEQLAWPAVETEPALENERQQQEGLFFHRLVQQHLLGLPGEKLVRLANTPDLSRWWSNWQDFRSLTDFGSLQPHPELTLSAPLGEHRLLAKYDLIAVLTSEIVPKGKKGFIYDWKTYRKRPRDEWMAARMQTRVYRALLVQASAHLNNSQAFTPEQIEMIYWYADFPTEPARFPYTATQYKRDWDGLTALAAEISTRSDFPLTADEKRCVYCPYRSYCDRGNKAGSLDEIGSEAELESVEINFEQIQEIEF